MQSMLQEISPQPRRRTADSPGASEGFDPVTGLATRGLFRSRAEQDWARSAGNRQRVSVIMFSIDRFREYDDAGQRQGLQVVAEVIRAHCRRRADFIGHLREHEFAVLLSGAGRQGTRQMAEAVCRGVAARKFRQRAGHRALTVSAGVASMVPRPTREVDALLIVADAGLRMARRLGGNRVRSSSKIR